MSIKLSPSTEPSPTAASVPVWTDTAKIRPRENPERLAWIVILTSFGIFLLLLITIPLGTRYILRYATTSQRARLEPAIGTLLFYPSGSAEAIALTTPREDITGNSRIEAAGASTQGTLTFLDESMQEALGSVQIYANTKLEIQRLRRPFFDSSPEPYQVKIYLEDGQAGLYTNTGSQRDGRPLHIELMTPHGKAELAPGTYQLSVTPERTEVIVREGSANLKHINGDSVVIDSTLRAWMTAESLTQKSADEEQNLIRMGDFAEVWTPYRNTERQDVAPGEVKFIENAGRKVAFFTRTDGANAHTEVGISQEIQKDVNVYDYLVVQFSVNILSQNLAGGGTRGSEFPLRLEIGYTDTYGIERTWGHGFYYLDPLLDDDPDNDYWSLADSTKVERATWNTYTSPNLIDLWSSQETPPARINSVRIYASGHKYQSFVSEVYLLAQ